MRKNILRSLALVGVGSLMACLGSATTPSQMSPQDVGDPSSSLTSGGVANTFNHDDDQRDPFDILAQRRDEGPPEISERMHSCKKIPYATLGQMLTTLGVDLNATSGGGLPTAGELYQSGAQALGAPNYASRTGEVTELSTAAATKLFDVFVQAAPEIIQAMPSLEACKVSGQATSMFNGDGTCNQDAISCLIGAPATQQHVDLCNQLVTSASSTDIGQKMAVATILAAAHTCE